MKKLIILSLIITSLFVISCKNGSDSSSGGGSGTTTPAASPLEGTWSTSRSGSSGITGSETFVFSGSNFSVAEIAVDSSSTPAVTTTMTFTGTFRVDNGNLHVTIQNATLVANSDPAVNLTTFEQVKAYVESDGTSTFPYTKGTEFLFGAYTINGNTLTITDSSDPSAAPLTFTKQ